MKSFLSILTLVSAASFTAQAAQKTISCSIDTKASEKLVAEKLNKQPWKKGRSGDDGAILVAGLDEITVYVKNDKVVGGVLVDMAAVGDDSLYLDKNGQAEAEELSASVTLSKKGALEIDITSRDSYFYSMQMSRDGKTAFLKGSFDWDCAGEGSDVYAVYTCEVSK